MKRTVLVVISSLLLLGLVLAGCTGEGGYGDGKMVGVWPKAEYAAMGSALSRIIVGLNWSDPAYTGIVKMTIPQEYKTAWGL